MNVHAHAQPHTAQDFPLHFTSPGQLLDIYTELEERNLFLIQNSQVGRGRGGKRKRGVRERVCV